MAYARSVNTRLLFVSLAREIEAQGPLTSSAPVYLGDAQPIGSPMLRVHGGVVTVVVHDAPTRFTLYVRDAAGWHRARVEVADLDALGNVDLAR